VTIIDIEKVWTHIAEGDLRALADALSLPGLKERRNDGCQENQGFNRRQREGRNDYDPIPVSEIEIGCYGEEDETGWNLH